MLSVASRGYRWLRGHGASSASSIRRTLKWVSSYAQYWRDWRAYQRMQGAEPLSFQDRYPCLTERDSTNAVDPHYFYQAVWAGKLIAQQETRAHVDVASDCRMVGMLTCFTQVTFIDIRPLDVEIEGLATILGDIRFLPLTDGSVPSLSCLNVAEHVGLGRYGDPLDPYGTVRAAAELSRVLAPGGSLYFSLPVGRSRVQFNAHRIHTPQQILNYFADLELRGYSVVDDNGRFIQRADPAAFEQARYALGLFWLRKPDR